MEHGNDKCENSKQKIFTLAEWALAKPPLCSLLRFQELLIEVCEGLLIMLLYWVFNMNKCAHFVPISPCLSVTWIGLCQGKIFLKEKEAAYPGRPLQTCLSHPGVPKRPLSWELSLCWHCSCSWAKQENLESSGCWANQTFLLNSAQYQLTAP